MQFRLDKCKILHIVRGKVQQGNYVIDRTEIITAMEPCHFFEYLGYKRTAKKIKPRDY